MPLVLLTRFAIQPDSELGLFEEDGKFQSGIHRSNSWFEHRLQIFEKFCLPSVLGQTDKNFRWCLFVDSRLAEQKKKRLLNSLAGTGELIEVIPGETLDGCVRRTFGVSGETFDAVRLDSDDMISRDFVSTLKRYSGQGDGVNLLHGVEYDVLKKTLTHRLIRSNPFLLLASKGDDHIFSYRNHVEVGQKRQLRNVLTSRPMYCRIIHGRNTAVPRQGGVPVLSPRLCGMRFSGSQAVFDVKVSAQVLILATRFGQVVFRIAPPLARFVERVKRFIADLAGIFRTNSRDAPS